MVKFTSSALLSLFAISASAAPAPAVSLEARSCGTVLAPYDIVQVRADQPDAPGIHISPYINANQGAGKAYDTKNLLRFNIPASVSQQQCALIMNFPPARLPEVYLTKPDPSTPVWLAVDKVVQSGTPLPNDPSYNQIVGMNGPWSVVDIHGGKQVMNQERCDQLKDFLLEVPEWVTDKMGASWRQAILDAANDGDNSFGIYLRYGDGC